RAERAESHAWHWRWRQRAQVDELRAILQRSRGKSRPSRPATSTRWFSRSPLRRGSHRAMPSCAISPRRFCPQDVRRNDQQAMTMRVLDTVLRGGQAVLQDGSIAETDIGIADGCIAAIAAPGTLSGQTAVDVKGLLVMPGAVDAHIHLG